MNKIRFIVLALFFCILTFTGREGVLFQSIQAQQDRFIFEDLCPQQFLDNANYHFFQNNLDLALTYYSLFINNHSQNATIEQVFQAYNRSAIIHTHRHDLRTAHELWTRVLILCEDAGYTALISQIYYNLGFVYIELNRHDIAKSYNLRALKLATDASLLVRILNNLGAVEQNTDTAFYFLNKALKISRKNDNAVLYCILSGMGTLYERVDSFDLALHYFYKSVIEARKAGNARIEARSLSNLGRLYFEINQTDSALFYTNLSTAVATEHNLLEVLMANYLILSEIDRSSGRMAGAYKHLKRYTKLKDSLINIGRFAEVSQLQQLYETMKTSRKNEQLVIQQQIKEHAIYFQQIILLIVLGVLLVVVLYSIFVFLQKRKLNKAYDVLFEKNFEITELQKNHSDAGLKKYRKSPLTEEMQEELLNKILDIMEDTSIICDAEFSIDKLAELLQSNSTYVSQVINMGLKKNFRSLLNGYRIKEAKRLFSEPHIARHTIEAVALEVGFKSRSTFYEVFKEVTGVSPNFYVKSLQKVLDE